MAKKAVEYEIRASGGQTIAELKRVGASMDEVSRKAKEMNAAGSGGLDTRSISKASGMSKAGVERFIGGGMGGDPGGVKGLKSAFGEESQLGQTMKIVRGAGAVAGIGIAAQLLNNATKEAEQLVLQFERGEISASEMVENLARSVPILGNVADAAVRVVGLITGATQETERLKAEAASQDRISDFQAGGLKRRKGYAGGQQEAATAIGARMALVGLEGYEADAERANQARVQAQQESSKKLAADLAKVDDEVERSIAKARADKNLSPDMRQAEISRIRKLADNEKEERKKAAKEIAAAEADVAAAEQDQKYMKLLESTNKWLDQLNREEEALRRQGVNAWADVMGRGFESEIQQMIVQGEERKRVFKEQLEEQLKMIPTAMRDTARARGEAVMKAMDQGTTGQLQAKFQRTLQDGPLATYEKLAAAGDKFAEAESRRLRLAKSLTEEYGRLKAIIDSTASTEEQKKMAREQMEGIAGRESSIVGWQLRNQKASLLQAQAQLGGPAGSAAALELERQNLRDEFEASSAGVAGVLGNPHATADQKRQAIMSLMGLAGTAGRRLSGTQEVGPQAQLVAADSSLLMSGVADEFKSANDPQKKIQELTKEGVELQKEIRARLTEFLNQFGPIIAQLNLAMGN